MDKIKMGIIGAGLAWENLHFPAYNRLKDKYEIQCVCDKDINKAKKAGNMLGLNNDRIYADYNKMLSMESIDAVDIMVPIEENYNVAMAAIQSGMNIIAEKPFASTPEAAKELMKAGKKQKIMVAENMRYDDGLNKIKEMLVNKKIGNTVYFIDNHVTEFQKEMLENSYASTEWRQHPEFEGGVFLDSGVHHIAKMRFLFGDIESVCAKGRPSDVDFAPYSCINAILSFKDHITGHYAFYTIGKETQAPLVGFRIFGTNGEIYLEEDDCGFINVTLKDGSRELISYVPKEGYYNELNNFYEAIMNNMEICSTPEKELGDILIINDLLESIKNNSIQVGTVNYKRKTRASM